MKRREFLRGCAVGCTLAAGPLTCGAARAAEGSAEPVIDPDKLAEAAYRNFIPGKRTCCESILMAGCEALGIESELVPDVALGLAGGVGFQGDMCGVISGSAMVISLAVARRETDYEKKMMRTLQATGRFHREFRKRFGHTDCRTLCGLDLTTPEGRKKLKQGVKAGKCGEYVKVGTRLLANELRDV